jgi:hypothetical protein
MQHTIEGKTFCITGTLHHYTRAQAEAAIREAGGKISKSVGKKTDFLVCGTAASRKLEKARSLGIPVIEEADLESFLAGDSVDVDEEIVVSGDASVRDLIGEARAALDGTHGSDAWSTLVDLVDACAPEQLPALVDFIEPQIARWEVSPHAQWRPGDAHKSCVGAPREWFDGAPRGELRVAPFRWLVEMNTGNFSPKHRLVHAVHLTGMKMNGTQICKLLGNPELTNLRVLDVDDSTLSKTFFKKLRALPSTAGLERLRLSRIDPKHASGADGDHHLDAFTHLCIHVGYHTDESATAELLGYPMFEGVTRLTVENYWPDKILKLLADTSPLLPNLRRVDLDSYATEYVRDGMKTRIFPRVEEVGVHHTFTSYNSTLKKSVHSGLNTFTRKTQGPETLDVSGLRIGSPNATKPLDVESILVAAFQGWELPANTRRVRLGRYWTERTAEAIRTLGAEPIR